MTDEIERVAAALWKADAERINALKSMVASRTPEAFAEENIYLRDKWRFLARAAIEAMQPDDDDGLTTIAYLAGAHDAKRDLRPSGSPSPITVRGSSIAKDRPSTPQEAAKLLTDVDRENIVDAIESIICETHEMDVRDVDYAENIVSWLERHHPAALRAIAGEDQT